MASISQTLSTKKNPDGKSEVLLRVVINHGNILRVKSGVFVKSECWLDKATIRDIKDKLEKESNKKGNGKRLSKNAHFEFPRPDISGAKGLLQEPKTLLKYPNLEDLILADDLLNGDAIPGKTEGGIIARISKLIETKREQPITKADLERVIYEVHNPKASIEEKESKQPKTLFEAMQAFIDDIPNKTHRGKPLNPKAIVHYRNTQKHVIEALRGIDRPLEEVDKSVFDAIVNHLVSTPIREIKTGKLLRNGFAQNTIDKQIRNLKAMLNSLPSKIKWRCDLLDLLDNNGYKVGKEDKDSIALTEAELKAIENLEIANPKLAKVRDQFLMLSWCGCRFSDLGKLRKENIVEEKFGRCFVFVQQKTQGVVYVPIFPTVQTILDRYNGNPPTPCSNQKFNEYVREVLKLASETEEGQTAGLQDVVTYYRTEGGKKVRKQRERWEMVTSHTGRKSFATNMYHRGVPTYSIMKLTGHKTEAAFLTYLKVSAKEHAEKMTQIFMNAINAKED